MQSQVRVVVARVDGTVARLCGHCGPWCTAFGNVWSCHLASAIVPDRFLQEPYKSDTSECLSQCLGLLSRDKQEFILDYHLYKGHAKIEHHRQMAGELAITEGALRTRAHHLRVTLEKCVLECIDNFGRNKTHVSSHR